MNRPRIRFLIGGVQKGGTTALATFLGGHPQIALPKGKEAHVFDAADYDPQWTPDEVDARYAGHFDSDGADVRLHGDATPIYCFHPEFVRRIAAYNPEMRWVLLLRHPVERAVSQYHMEHARGDESWPFWPAMILESWRLRGHWEDFSQHSPMRHFSYRARGDYARQLDVLYAHFPKQQVLLLQNEVLQQSPDKTLAAVVAFLGLPDHAFGANLQARVFSGRYTPFSRHGWRFRLLRWLMAEPLRRMRVQYGLDWP